MNKKILSSILALAFVLGAAAPASAATVAELQALIAQLQAQIAALTGGQYAGSYTYSKDLTIGSTGADVVALQSALESKGFLVIPVGVSKGYFGPLTQRALASYQASVGISPAAGYFGPITRAHFNSMVVIPGNGGGTGNNDGGSTTDTLKGGEASLEDYNLKKGNDSDVSEGDEGEVAVIEFDVEDGDVKIERLDLTFEFMGTTGEDKPWKAFDRITLRDEDGDKIASEDVSDEDDWLDEDEPFVFRFSGLKYVVREGDKAEISVEIEAAGSVDDADTNGANDWKVYVDDDSIRAIDAEGIYQYIGDDSDAVTFGIEEEGAGEGIDIKSSSSDPKASTLLVDSNDKSEWHEVFIFNLEADENDIEVDKLVLTVDTDTADFEDVVNDMVIEIDGEEFDDYKVANANSTSATVTFDIDKDFTIDADDMSEVVVMVEFRAQAGNYVNGQETIQIEATSVEGEGKDDVSDTSSLSSKVHTLSTSVAEISNLSSTVSKDDPNDSGAISWKFKITAEDDDVTFDVADNSNVDGTTDDVVFDILGTDSSIAVVSLTKLSGKATYAGGTWTINEGDSATFALDATFTTVDAGDNGTYYIYLNTVAGSSVDETSSGLTLSF